MLPSLGSIAWRVGCSVAMPRFLFAEQSSVIQTLCMKGPTTKALVQYMPFWCLNSLCLNVKRSGNEAVGMIRWMHRCKTILGQMAVTVLVNHLNSLLPDLAVMMNDQEHQTDMPHIFHEWAVLRSIITIPLYLLFHQLLIDDLTNHFQTEVNTIRPSLFLEAAFAANDPQCLAAVLRFFSDFIPGFIKTSDHRIYCGFLKEMS